MTSDPSTEMRLYVNPELKLIVQTFTGVLSIEGWKASMAHVWQHPEYSPEFRGVVDLRNCRLTFGPKELCEVIDLLRDNANGLTIRAKGALMVGEPVSAAISTIYKSNMKDFHDAEVFCNNAAVCKYLDVPISVFDSAKSVGATKVQLS